MAAFVWCVVLHYFDPALGHRESSAPWLSWVVEINTYGVVSGPDCVRGGSYEDTRSEDPCFSQKHIDIPIYLYSSRILLLTRVLLDAPQTSRVTNVSIAGWTWDPFALRLVNISKRMSNPSREISRLSVFRFYEINHQVNSAGQNRDEDTLSSRAGDQNRDSKSSGTSTISTNTTLPLFHPFAPSTSGFTTIHTVRTLPVSLTTPPLTSPHNPFPVPRPPAL